MTRPRQKQAERRTLDAIFAALGLRPDRAPEEGETPDFIVHLAGRAIGVEVTMYQSGDAVEGGLPRRAVENEWDVLKNAADAFRAIHPKIRDVSVGLMFSGAVPPRKHHQAFIDEVLAFAKAHESEWTCTRSAYWPRQFPSPLMRGYLRTLYLRHDEYAEWYSSVTAGYVTRPDHSIAAIVAQKSTKTFRPADELWLAIQCSTRISELVLEFDGVADFQSVPSLDPYAFERVFFFTFTGTFEWTRGAGWRQLTAPTASRPFASLDRV